MKRSLVRVALLLSGAALLGTSSRTAGAQTPHVILVVPPLPSDQADSAFALDLAEKLRKAIGRSWERRAVPFREMCRTMRASDYSCRKLMDEDEVAHLSSALGADAHITGSFTRDPNFVMELRVTSRPRAGYAGSFEVRGGRWEKPDSVIPLAREGFDALWIAAAMSRACYEARDAGLYFEAIRFAEGARAIVTNHSTAALCMASVFELTNQPPDSLIKAYGWAVAGDSRLHEMRRRLTLLYHQKGDTLSASVLLAEDLRREPEDANLRARVAVNWIAAGRPDSAFRLLYAADGMRAENVNLLRVVARACLDREMWRCEYEALARQYTLGADLVGDTTFYFQIIGAAQNVGDARAVLTWTTEALRHLPPVGTTGRAVRSLWMAYAGALRDAGKRDEAVGVYLDLWKSDTTDIRPALAAAEALVDPRFLNIDSTIPLDTTALRTADSLLTTLAERNRDQAVSQTIATIYFAPAAALVQGKVAPALASVWLEKAMRHDIDGRMDETASSLNGLALSHVVQHLDEQIREQPTCALVDRTERTINQARAATLEGQGAFPDVARRVLQALEAYEYFIPQYREILQCGKGVTGRLLVPDRFDW